MSKIRNLNLFQIKKLDLVSIQKVFLKKSIFIAFISLTLTSCGKTKVNTEKKRKLLIPL